MSGKKQISRHGARRLRSTATHINDVLNYLEKQGVVVEEVKDQQTKAVYTVVEKKLGELSLSLCGIFDGIYRKKYVGMNDFPVRIKAV